MVWYSPTPPAEDTQSASSSTGAAVTTAPGGTKDAVTANATTSGGAPVKGGGFKLRRRPTPLPMTMAAAAAVAAVDGAGDRGAAGGSGEDGIDPNNHTLDPILLTRSISMKAAQSFNDYFSSLAARNIGGLGWNAENNNNDTGGDEAEARDQTNSNSNNKDIRGDGNDDSDESYVHPFERRGWDRKFGGNPWAAGGGGIDRSGRPGRTTSSLPRLPQSTTTPIPILLVVKVAIRHQRRVLSSTITIWIWRAP